MSKSMPESYSGRVVLPNDEITKNRGLKMGVISLYSAVNGRGHGNLGPFGAKEQHDSSMIFMHIYSLFCSFLTSASLH